MNSLTGDTNFNFTATLLDYDPTKVVNATWALSASDANEIAGLWPYVTTGKMFKDGLPRNGFTQTWNFDDDGILAPYSFDPDSTFTNPTDNRYGGFGPGTWNVYAYIILTNRFYIVLQQQITVGTPVVEADFGWTQNLANNFGQVSFVDTSVNHEVGEPDSYAWDFGDGTISAERNPIHVYNPTGPSDNEFDVSLTVFTYGPGGVKVPDTKIETITLTQPTMAPNFTWVANAQVVTFTNTSTNVGFEEPDAYFWEFGDGTTSTLKNPVHTFPVANENVPESFSVKLTTRNIWEQTASVTKTVTTTALNKSGTFPVRYIKFKIDAYTKPGTVPSVGDLFAINPVMSNLKAVTSGTGVNLSYLKPLVGFNDNSIPRMRWFATNGQSVQQSLGWEFFLTRDPALNPTTSYGDGPASQNQTNAGQPYSPVVWELVVDLGQPTQLINDILLRFEDLFVLSGTFAGLHVESFYPKITVEVANVVTDYTPNPSGTFGPATLNGNWVNIGYFKLDGGRMDPTKPSGQRTNTTKTIFKMRPLPLNIPYFNYTFNDKIVSFTSVETADSYAWNFGDGTTSTLKNPVKTYASYGTYTVSLAVTNGGIVTRTTTEPVIVQAPVI
jgi:PKD repeat protein